ncbi:hypothetical protein VTN96DRAFT_8801 [Rasamsonia emersonii]
MLKANGGIVCLSLEHVDTCICHLRFRTVSNGSSTKMPDSSGCFVAFGWRLAVSGASRAQLTRTDQPPRRTIVNRPDAASLNDPCFEPSNFAYERERAASTALVRASIGAHRFGQNAAAEEQANGIKVRRHTLAAGPCRKSFNSRHIRASTREG